MENMKIVSNHSHPQNWHPVLQRATLILILFDDLSSWLPQIWAFQWQPMGRILSSPREDKKSNGTAISTRSERWQEGLIFVVCNVQKSGKRGHWRTEYGSGGYVCVGVEEEGVGNFLSPPTGALKYSRPQPTIAPKTQKVTPRLTRILPWHSHQLVCRLYHTTQYIQYYCLVMLQLLINWLSEILHQLFWLEAEATGAVTLGRCRNQFPQKTHYRTVTSQTFDFPCLQHPMCTCAHHSFG